VIGGVLTDATGWRLLFWLNVPLAAVLAGAVPVCVPADARDRPDGRDGRDGPERPERLDAAGAALLTAAVMGLVGGAALLERPSLRLIGAGLLAVGVGLVAVFRRVQRRVSSPLLPASALRDPQLRPGLIASFLNTATTSSAATLATLHLQESLGLSASAAGLLLLPGSLGVIVGSTLAVPVLRRLTLRAGIGVGLGLIALGNLTFLAVAAGRWVVPVAVAMYGLGLGLSSVAATTLGTDVPEALQGTASGALNTAAQLGTAIGVAAFLLVAFASTDTAVPLGGNRLGWLAAAVSAAIGAVVLSRTRMPVRTPSGG
jgi:predicted MFS family arabinose efflux permease